MKLQTKNIYICFESRKRTKKQAQNDINKIEWLKMHHLIFFSQCACLDGSSHHNGPYEKQSEIGQSLIIELNVLVRARAQLLNMLYISTHLSVPLGGNI